MKLKDLAYVAIGLLVLGLAYSIYRSHGWEREAKQLREEVKEYALEQYMDSVRIAFWKQQAGEDLADADQHAAVVDSIDENTPLLEDLIKKGQHEVGDVGADTLFGHFIARPE
jgi:hypothetical protein